MKTCRKWLALALCLMLMTALSAPALAAGGGVDPAHANFVDTWYFSSITFTSDVGGISAGTVLTAEDVGSDLYVVTFSKNGRATCESTMEGSDFTATWVQDGITATLTDETGTFLVTMIDEDTIVLDAAEDGGYIMTLVRQGSDAYRALIA